MHNSHKEVWNTLLTELNLPINSLYTNKCFQLIERRKKSMLRDYPKEVILKSGEKVILRPMVKEDEHHRPQGY
jgi:hypothetical protein